MNANNQQAAVQSSLDELKQAVYDWHDLVSELMFRVYMTPTIKADDLFTMLADPMHYHQALEEMQRWVDSIARGYSGTLWNSTKSRVEYVWNDKKSYPMCHGSATPPVGILPGMKFERCQKSKHQEVVQLTKADLRWFIMMFRYRSSGSYLTCTNSTAHNSHLAMCNVPGDNEKIKDICPDIVFGTGFGCEHCIAVTYIWGALCDKSGRSFAHLPLKDIPFEISKFAHFEKYSMHESVRLLQNGGSWDDVAAAKTAHRDLVSGHVLGKWNDVIPGHVHGLVAQFPQISNVTWAKVVWRGVPAHMTSIPPALRCRNLNIPPYINKLVGLWYLYLVILVFLILGFFVLALLTKKTKDVEPGLVMACLGGPSRCSERHLPVRKVTPRGKASFRGSFF